jgi:hypothetical protein
MNAPAPTRERFHLLDLLALVIGYSLASLLVRAFWPSAGVPDGGTCVALALGYLWLGLAMSGPLVLAGHRRAVSGEGESAGPVPRTWAELAWLVIGFYWIGLTLLIVPVRLHESRVLDTACLGLFPIAAACALRIVRPRLSPSRANERAWTHRAGIALLVSWPFAWVALILVGKGLP